MLCKLKWKHQAERRLPTFTSLSLCCANKVETSAREKATYLHLSVSMLCKLKRKHQAERRLPTFTSLSLCSANYSGNIRQREDYLPSLLCLYALQTTVETSGREKTTYFHFSVSMLCKLKWKHQAERRLPTFTSLPLYSANKVKTSRREKTTYFHFSVSMLCKLQWKHQAERRLPSFTSLSQCSAN